MFNIGDRVVCIDNTDMGGALKGILPALIKGREYIVYSISSCEGCGTPVIDVGLVANSAHTRCVCRHRSSFTTNVHYCNAKRFRKVEEKKEYVAVSTNVEVDEPCFN
jgi:hypothetical protein